MNKLLIIIVCSLAMMISSSLYSQETKTASPTSKENEEKSEGKEEKEEKKKRDTKTIAEATESCTKIEGLFPIYQDTAKGNIFMEVRLDQMNKEFLHFFHSENGSLNAGWVKGNYGWESIL